MANNIKNGLKNILVWFHRNVFPSVFQFIISIICALTSSYLVYTSFFQRHFFSWRYLIIAGFSFLFFSFLFGYINTKFLSLEIIRINKNRRIVFFILAIFLAFAFLVNIQIQPIYYLLPDSEFILSFDVVGEEGASDGVQLLWINTGQGFIHRSRMDIEGTWSFQDHSLNFENAQSVTIHWVGKAGSKSEIVFRSTNVDQIINIKWNGENSQINLKKQHPINVVFMAKTTLPFVFKILYIAAFLTSFIYLITLVSVFASLWKPKYQYRGKKRTLPWLLYMACIMVIWMFSLFVYWPGVMSKDSIDLWNQAVTGDFNDWQSAFYSAILFSLIRIIYSPSFILVLQILSFSFLVAYGLWRFEKRGVPKIILWIICIIFAVSPLNNMQVITLWKDIPYAVAFFWITILIFEIFDSDGNWITNWKHTAIFVFFSAAISILRLNGIPVIVLTILFLAVVYKNQRKWFFAIFGSLIVIFLLIKGPFYNLIGVDREIRGQSNQILLHHIAAHLDAETNFEESEREYLNDMLPLSEWDYQCCYMGPIYLNRNFKRAEFLSNSIFNRELALKLFIRDPVVDVEHTLCAGEPAWRFGQNQCQLYSTHGFNTWEAGKQDWIIPNEFSLEESSLFPGIIRRYSSMLRDFGFLDDNLVPYLRPAFSFYIFILSLAIAYLRNNDWKIFLIGTPIILQTFLLFFINFAPVFRYFYATNLVGTFFIGLLFYQKKNDCV